MTSSDAALDAILAAGRGAWPAVVLSAEIFRQHLRTLGVNIEEAGGRHGLDLYLACACVHGDPAALQAFEAAHLSRVPVWLRTLRLTPSQVQEIGQMLRVKLLAPPTPKLSDYSGRAALQTFVRICAMNTGLHLLESAAERKRSDVGDAWLERVADGGLGDADRHLVRRLDGVVFKAAMQEALGALSPDERNLMRFHYLDGMTLDEIARLRGGVHKSTIHRELKRLRGQILDSVMQALRARCEIQAEELNSLAAYLGSAVDLSLSRVLSDG